MHLAVICFTKNGSNLAARIRQRLQSEGETVEAFSIKKYAKENKLIPLTIPMKQWTEEMFQKTDGILFIGATGIAVRSIAPFIKDKTKDPAILVLDEQGKFVISLLSGHIGGANELTERIASFLQSIPVITTATDINGKFSVDTFAKKQELILYGMGAKQSKTARKYAKEISAAILEEESVGFKCDCPIQGKLPNGIKKSNHKEQNNNSLGIYITQSIPPNQAQPFEKTLYLLPKKITLGIGCKKNTSREKIENFVLESFLYHGLQMEQIEQVVSIDLKKEENGLLEFCKKYQVPFYTYSAEELKEVEGEFTASDFVKSVTGVSNVCERSAIRGSKYGTLIQRKTAKNGVTVAIAIRDWSIRFEE